MSKVQKVALSHPGDHRNKRVSELKGQSWGVAQLTHAVSNKQRQLLIMNGRLAQEQRGSGGHGPCKVLEALLQLFSIVFNFRFLDKSFL